MKFCYISFVFGLTVLQFLVPSNIVIAQSATDSCTSTLPLNGLAFDSSLLQCVEGWKLQNYILRYAKTAENTWDFILSAPDSSAYIAIGFSTTGRMVGSSAIVGWTNSGKGDVKQYLLTGKSPGLVILDQEDIKIVNGSTKIESVSSRLYMSFQLTAELPRERLLYAMGPSGFFPASPEFALMVHQFVTSTTIKYIPGPATFAPTMSPGPATTPTSGPSLTPSSAYGLSPSLLFFGIGLLALKFY
ncbi:hypothetical protein AALP_AA3G084300 [Arabis alpina]|uniref:DOMON domain-containing protein n=1 Tax=Arabis alpina TaxID=50452 RepID=A0A087H7W7_ARAAL|nr:hypothetical protein AALP_AA3G084300 [Arabis alpina]